MEIAAMKKKINLNLVFSIGLLGCIAIYWGIMIITRCKLIDTYYVNDFTNTYMDYFNMLANLSNLKPYENDANYPAMCFLIWRVMMHMIPLDAVNEDGYFYRDYLPATLGYIIYSIIIVLAVWEILKTYINGNKVEKLIISASIILSGPFVFTIERGNIIILSFLFLLAFCFLYQSDKKAVRYIGYFCLAMSAAIKIYPAIFGVMLLIKKKASLKEIMATIIMGVVVFVLPFFFFDGFQSLSDMFNGIFFASNLQANWGMGYNFCFSNLIKIMASLTGVLYEQIAGGYKIIGIVVCVFIFLLNDAEWKKLFALALTCIWIPDFSYTYTLLLFIPALIAYFNSEKYYKDITSVIYRTLFLIIFMPIALPSMSRLDYEGAKFPLSYPTLIINMAIVLMVVCLLFDGIVNTSCDYLLKNRNVAKISKERAAAEETKNNMGGKIWEKIEKLIEFILTKVFRLKINDKQWEALLQFVKFGVVGLSNTLISYILYIGALFFFEKNDLIPNIDYLIAQVIAFVLSVLWSFYWNNKYVFKKGEDGRRNIVLALLKTYVSYAFTGLILNSILSFVWVEILHVSKIIAPIINLLVSVPVNYIMNKCWAFKDK